MPRSSHLAYLLSLASIGYAQNVVPFSVTGGLEDCSAGTEYNAGGSISVNAFNIQVPKNLIVQFPTVFAPFKDLCSAGARGFETTVVGNIVGTQAIAGQITVAQRFGLEGSQGYISAINPDGSLQIQGGPKVTLNDPDGLFGPKVTSNPMWVADTSSPSVTSFSGFPMCIPYDGNKDKCLTSNRGSGQSFTPQDQLSMVPLKVGDFIEYSGLRTDSGILASDITCISLHITTSGRADGVNYIRVEDMLIGVPDTAANVEFAGIKAVGFLSSCNDAIVTISAIDVDPCTGKETYREIGTARPKVETRCKWEAKIDHPGKAPFTREYRITTNSPIKETKDGLQAGEFITAVTEWIFPELDTPGNNPPPFPFKDITDVVQGTVLDGKQYGQLDPFPGASPGSPSKACKPEDLITATPTPSASATPSAEASGQASDASAVPTSTPAVTPPQASVAAIANAVRVGADFVLTGSNTESKYTNADLNFAWSQISPASPSPTIGNGNSPTATVNAGRVSGTTDTPFVYELTVSLKSNSAVSSKANVTVKVNPSMADTVSMTAYTYSNSQSGTIAVSCNSNVINTDNKKMQLSINPGAAGARLIDMTQNGPGKWQYNARSFGNRPNTLKCVSDLKGESALRQGTQTTARKRRWTGL